MKAYTSITVRCALLFGWFLVMDPVMAEEYAVKSMGGTLTNVESGGAAQQAWGPWDGTAWETPAPAAPYNEKGDHHPIAHFFRISAVGMIRLFQRYISPVDGQSCSFYPSCSSYGLKAIQKHGLLIGVPMAAERIMRNHRVTDSDRYSLIERNGTFYYYDPVEANEFWRRCDKVVNPKQ